MCSHDFPFHSVVSMLPSVPALMPKNVTTLAFYCGEDFRLFWAMTQPLGLRLSDSDSRTQRIWLGSLVHLKETRRMKKIAEMLSSLIGCEVLSHGVGTTIKGEYR